MVFRDDQIVIPIENALEFRGNNLNYEIEIPDSGKDHEMNITSEIQIFDKVKFTFKHPD